MSYFEYNAKNAGMPAKTAPVKTRESRSEFTASVALQDYRDSMRAACALFAVRK